MFEFTYLKICFDDITFVRCIHEGSSSSVMLAEGNPIQGVHFDVPYHGEDSVTDGKDTTSFKLMLFCINKDYSYSFVVGICGQSDSNEC